eukprot:403332606
MQKVAQQASIHQSQQEPRVIKAPDMKQYEQMSLYKKLKSKTIQSAQSNQGSVISTRNNQDKLQSNQANQIMNNAKVQSNTYQPPIQNFTNPAFLNMSQQKESNKLNLTLQKLKENINNQHGPNMQKGNVQGFGKSGQEQNKSPNQSYFNGPIKGSRDALPSLNLQTIEENSKLHVNAKTGQVTKIPIVQKQIVYTRTDSVKSSATTYPHTTQGGSTKVVRLIRGENDDHISALIDTTRGQGLQSVLKGINTSTNSNGLVRKIQTPQVFKCKQKPAKRTSQAKNQSQGNLVFMNQSDYNPFVTTSNQQNISQNLQPFHNPFTTQPSPQPASRFIYTEKKDINDPARIVSTDNINIKMSSNVFDEDLQIRTQADDEIFNANLEENKMNFSFVGDDGGPMNNNDLNNSFGNNSEKQKKQSFINNEYYHTSNLIKEKPKQLNMQVKENYKAAKEAEIIKKYGIKKIVPSNQSSKLRNETNLSRQTDRSNNTVFSTGSNYSRKEKGPAKQRSTGDSNPKAAQVKNLGKIVPGFGHNNYGQQPLLQSARTQIETFHNPFNQNQKAVPLSTSNKTATQHQQEPFNPFKQPAPNQIKKPIYGSVSPERKLQQQHNQQMSSALPSERSDISDKSQQFKQFQNRMKAYGQSYQQQ